MKSICKNKITFLFLLLIHFFHVSPAKTQSQNGYDSILPQLKQELVELKGDKIGEPNRDAAQYLKCSENNSFPVRIKSEKEESLPLISSFQAMVSVSGQIELSPGTFDQYHIPPSESEWQGDLEGYFKHLGQVSSAGRTDLVIKAPITKDAYGSKIATQLRAIYLDTPDDFMRFIGEAKVTEFLFSFGREATDINFLDGSDVTVTKAYNLMKERALKFLNKEFKEKKSEALKKLGETCKSVLGDPLPKDSLSSNLSVVFSDQEIRRIKISEGAFGMPHWISSWIPSGPYSRSAETNHTWGAVSGKGGNYPQGSIDSSHDELALSFSFIKTGWVACCAPRREGL